MAWRWTGDRPLSKLWLGQVPWSTMTLIMLSFKWWKLEIRPIKYQNKLTPHSSCCLYSSVKREIRRDVELLRNPKAWFSENSTFLLDSCYKLTLEKCGGKWSCPLYVVLLSTLKQDISKLSCYSHFISFLCTRQCYLCWRANATCTRRRLSLFRRIVIRVAIMNHDCVRKVWSVPDNFPLATGVNELVSAYLYHKYA